MAKSKKVVPSTTPRPRVSSYFVVPVGTTVPDAIAERTLIAGPCDSKSGALTNAKNALRDGNITAGGFTLVKAQFKAAATFTLAPVTAVQFVKN